MMLLVLTLFVLPVADSMRPASGGGTTRNIFAFPTLPASCTVRLLHAPEHLFFASDEGEGFSFRIERAHPPQLAGRCVVSAVDARVNGRLQSLRLISDANRSTVVCLGADGTPFITFDFTVSSSGGEKKDGSVLQVDTHYLCAAKRLSRSVQPFFVIIRRLQEKVLLLPVQNDNNEEEGDDLARHRAALFKRVGGMHHDDDDAAELKGCSMRW